MKRLIFFSILVWSILTGPAGISQYYKNTRFSPVLDVAIGNHENVVYALSFHQAWKNLQDNILHEKVLLDKELTCVDLLNQDLPVILGEDCAVSLAGFVSDGIDKDISRELKEKFNREIDLSAYAKEESNIICYAFFRKDIKFSTIFESYGQAFPFFSDGKIFDMECFGIWNKGNSPHHQELSELVSVYDYVNSSDFIVGLSNPGEKDELVIAVCEPAGTLQEMIDKVLQRMGGDGNTELVDNDRLILPKVHIDLHHTFDELYGVHLANKGFESYFFAGAGQDVLFNLDESGAQANAEAKIILIKGPGPRTMMVNRPFLLMMKEKGDHQPYFAAWIADPELLTASGPLPESQANQ